MTSEKLKAFILRHYTREISRDTPATGTEAEVVDLLRYEPDQLRNLPPSVASESFGCGNPLAFAELKPGQTVVDIGSGAGLDCMLAAARVGVTGRVIGVDVTPAMIERARFNARQAGMHNVEFRLADVEALPIEDQFADWIISNCVINLASDKQRVFGETFRVLRNGGRIMLSDIVARFPPGMRRACIYASHMSQSIYSSGIGGTIDEAEYLSAIEAAGFRDVRVVDRLIFRIERLSRLFQQRPLLGPIVRIAARPGFSAIADRILQRASSIHVAGEKPC